MPPSIRQPPFIPGGSNHYSESLHSQLYKQPEAASTSQQTQPRRTIVRKVAATKSTIIQSQLQVGVVEVNIAALTRPDVQKFVEKLRSVATTVKVLRLRSIPRDVPQLAYTLNDLNEMNQDDRPPPFSSEVHKRGVCVASAHIQHQDVRFIFYSCLDIMLTKGCLQELELGMRLSQSGYDTLNRGLAASTFLRRLSFRGSHMGDEPLQRMQAGLQSSTSLEELDLTACSLTDIGVSCVAEVVKSHAQRRSVASFQAGLRQYPDPSLPPAVGHMMHYAAMRQAAQQVDEECGGLLHLELAENPQMSDRAALELRDALSVDRRMVLLSLRGTGISHQSEGEFVALVRSHQALARVDMRQCSGAGAKHMGILKLHKGGAHALLDEGSPRKGCARRPGSPTLTVRSVALQRLLDDDATSVGGRSRTSLKSRNSALSTASGVLPSKVKIKRTLSTISWGDQHLLSNAGIRGARAAAGAGASVKISCRAPGILTSAFQQQQSRPDKYQQQDQRNADGSSNNDPFQRRQDNNMSYNAGISLGYRTSGTNPSRDGSGDHSSSAVPGGTHSAPSSPSVGSPSNRSASQIRKLSWMMNGEDVERRDKQQALHCPDGSEVMQGMSMRGDGQGANCIEVDGGDDVPAARRVVSILKTSNSRPGSPKHVREQPTLLAAAATQQQIDAFFWADPGAADTGGVGNATSMGLGSNSPVRQDAATNTEAQGHAARVAKKTKAKAGHKRGRNSTAHTTPAKSKQGPTKQRSQHSLRACMSSSLCADHTGHSSLPGQKAQSHEYMQPQKSRTKIRQEQEQQDIMIQDQAVAQVVAMIRDLELEVSKAEYMALLDKQDRAAGLKPKSRVDHASDRLKTLLNAHAALDKQAVHAGSPQGNAPASSRSTSYLQGVAATAMVDAAVWDEAMQSGARISATQAQQKTRDHNGQSGAASGIPSVKQASAAPDGMQEQLCKWIAMCDDALQGVLPES